MAAVFARRLFVATGSGLTGAAVYRYWQVQQREGLLSTEPLEIWNTATTASEKSRVIIIGGGVVGVTTAYKLGLAGHAVTVLESASQAAAECSACAAGGMQRSNPAVDYKSWIAVLQCLFPTAGRVLLGTSTDDDFKFFHQSWLPTLSDPFFLRWLLTFTKTSLFPDSQQEYKQRQMLEFTKFAVEDMCQLMEKRWENMSKVAGYNTRGSLSVSYDPLHETSATSANPTHSKNTYEPARQLVGDELLKEEPSLDWQQKKPTSARFEYETKSASSQRWTRELARRCHNDPKLNVSIQYGTKVQAISTTNDGEKPRITQLKTSRGIIDVTEDIHVVVAAGAWTSQILALMDLYAPVYPLKGYAMSVSAKEALNQGLKPKDLPSRIICDKYMFTSRLGDDEIRLTSIGEFSGWSTSPTPNVDEDFRQEAIRQFPQLQNLIRSTKTYCGHRPFINDGILLLGAVDTHHNLFVSSGPGSNGWKLAMGSGEVIRRLVEGQSSKQIHDDLGCDVDSFSPAGRVRMAPWFAKLCRARWNV